VKRCIDVIGSLVAMVLFSPVWAAAAVLVLIRMGRPVLFRQMRTGLNEEPFALYKLRTMSNARGPDGELLADGERLTPLGRALRRWSVDELPQLWNVLKGDMSLVGPRPLLMKYLPRYSSEQKRRHLVRPGITGWAQVSGRNAITWEQKFEFDVWYVDNAGLWLDVRILAATAFSILGGKGIGFAGPEAMVEFRGDSRAGGIV
jgi:lipopolysaccharide/colanic/teichoic acid biosynthesis glycosyltransferase